MGLENLTYAPGSRKQRKRVGRGQGSGTGGTAGKGHKGQRSRSGSKRRAWFEGGQMPLQRRLPKRGFTNIFKQEFQVVNLQDFKKLGAVKTVDPNVLLKKGLIKKKNVPVKILGDGEIKKAIEVSANSFSKSAKEKIEAAGGKVTVL